MVYLILRNTWTRSSIFVFPERHGEMDELMNFFAERVE